MDYDDRHDEWITIAVCPAQVDDGIRDFDNRTVTPELSSPTTCPSLAPTEDASEPPSVNEAAPDTASSSTITICPSHCHIRR
jgi:hypothetical protein